tara:strand:- start:715 stop:1590 length:876 start_codon:yes stop_codon:yes gene_type:complete
MAAEAIKQIRKRKYEPLHEEAKQGAHGSVILCRDEKKCIVAVKKIEESEAREKETEIHALREIAAYKRIKNHDNILSLLEIIHESSMFLVLTAMDMTLSDVLRSCNDDDILFSYKEQLAKGIAFCHSHKIMHRDIKPQNILVTNTNLKIGDFGLAKRIRDGKQHSICAVTLWYRPIEILLGDSYYNETIDVWSCACVFYEIDTKQRLFAGDSEVDTLMKIYLCLGMVTEDNLPNCKRLPNYNSDIKFKKKDQMKGFPSLYLKMLKYDKKERIRSHDVCRQLHKDVKVVLKH